MKKQIAAVVVLFLPDLKLLGRNIRSYISFVDKLYVIDNSPADQREEIVKCISEIQDAIYIGDGKNKGIGTALNQAAKLSIKDGYSWLLTMDQDSCFAPDQAEEYFTIFESRFAKFPELAVISPSHFRNETEEEPGEYSELVAVMTSGNLIRLSAWQKIQGFDEKLFIDEVDHDYCYRLRKSAWKIIRLNKVFIIHELGSQKEAGYLGSIARRSRRIHSPKRIYFMVRNYLYVRKQYRIFFPADFEKRDKEFRVTLKNNLLFSGKFKENLSLIWKGYQDYKNGNFSQEL